MKTLIFFSILTLSAQVAAEDKPIKLKSASWKSGLSIENEVSEEAPVRLPSQNKKHKVKPEAKPANWNYLSPEQVDLEGSFDSANSKD